MPLQPGVRLGPYEVIAQIGEGGMGEVYRATDTNLKRAVALKVLPDSVAGDPERLARFQREAEVLAALNHPNIAHIHGLEKSAGVTSLVMELVEGPTLADRIAAGPIGLEDSLPIAMQIAEALEAAHALGIVHRDLKPANIKVRSDGVVKVLDFGLAKALEPASALSKAIVDSPTITSPAMMTRTGMILGTAAYMSPEQAKGRATDTRSDVWSFGCVLFEMLTGTIAFGGATVTETLAAVIRAEPDWSQLPAGTPPLVSSLLRRCLQKDLRRRLQAIGDARITLEEAVGGGVDVPVAAARRDAAWRRLVPWALLAATVLGFAGLTWVREARRTPPVPAQPVRLQIPIPSKPPLRVSGLFALSPDGQQLAFAASSSDGIPRIWLRPLSSLEIRPLAGTEGVGTLLFWSPDSRFIAFDSGGKIQKISVSGGPSDPVCAFNRTPVGGSWNKAGDIIFGQFGGPIMHVPAGSGAATPVTALDAANGDVAHNVPVFLPDDRHFIYFRDTGTDGAISVGSLDAKPGAQDTRRFRVDFGAAYVPGAESNSGMVVFLRRGTLMAQPFDERRLELSGEAAPLVEGPISGFYDYGLFSTSTNGTLMYWSPGGVQRQLTWFDAQGGVLSTVGEPGPYGDLALSPDGSRAFLSKTQELEEGVAALWLVDMSRGTSTRFELDRSAYNQSVIWSPDGRQIIFGSARTGQMMDLYQKPIAGSAEPEALVKSSDWKTPLGWSPDGRSVLFASQGDKTRGDVWVLPLGQHRAPVPLLQTTFDERDAEFSPDGRWIAYVSNESGRDEVYVRAFSSDASGAPLPDSGNKSIVSGEGGAWPKWKRDGTELYYVDLAGKLMAATVSTRPMFQAGVPRLLFQPPSGSADVRWSPSPDGKRFLFLVPETQGTAPFTVILNWAGLLKRGS
jgi:serine/threonine protein kinase/Tol biopolymer transport system component